MDKQQLSQLTIEAVNNNDARLAGQVVDVLRFELRMNHQQCQQWFETSAGCDGHRFEDLMWEVDNAAY